ncbi:putative ABC transporter ATP-binding protein YheS [bacterium MnTg02]|nr:putative ABC transporter ATP-binding protein YheS [bacterium MnTg02]
MLHINSLTFRIDGRLLFEQASTTIPKGHKVGLVGRNGTGKTTLLKLISGELSPEGGGIRLPKNARIGIVAQEAPGGPTSLIDWVLAADQERADLLGEAETATDPNRIAEIQIRLTDIDAHTAPARASSILAGLGFDEQAQQCPCADYSGGWRMRVALAAVLFSEPDLLLLDEPSNYLDLEGTLWLEEFLRNYRHTVLIVSHDRDLLNGSVTGIVQLRERQLSFYSGGYDRFEATRREQQRLELKLKKKQDDERRRIESFVDRFRAKATKARQAQSRIKALARMQPIAAQIDERVIPFQFPSPEKALGNPLMRFEDASTGYGPDNIVLSDLNLRIDSDDRIGLLGANGNGKSTFAKLVCRRLEVFSGYRRASKKLEIGFFTQHQIDDLSSNRSAYDHIAELMEGATEAQKRSRLGQIGFGADKADTAAGQLSGGEKARLMFALATFHGPHLLILDEPTNHLDVDSREALIHALNDFEGAIILISHDRHLLETCVDRLWVAQAGTVSPYDGDLESYRAECLSTRSIRKPSKRKSGAEEHPLPLSKQDQRRLLAEKRAARAPLKKIMAAQEKRVEELSQKIARLDKDLSDSSLYAQNPGRAKDLTKERGQLARALSEAEADWLIASENYENAAR